MVWLNVIYDRLTLLVEVFGIVMNESLMVLAFPFELAW